jgi:predicted metal-dependent hydrolase
VPGTGTVAPVNQGNAEIVVRRSARRKRSISATRQGDQIVIAIPGHFTKAQEQEWVAKMTARLRAAEKRRRPSDADLVNRAAELSGAYLGGKAKPSNIRWATNQNTRWGSATLPDGAIRISNRLQGMPKWVVDYVILHELAHLLQPGHGPRFWALLADYPQLERAKGFLEGVAYRDHSDEAGKI